MEMSPRIKKKKKTKKKRSEKRRELNFDELPHCQSDPSPTLGEEGGEETTLTPGGEGEEESLDMSSGKTGVGGEEEERTCDEADEATPTANEELNGVH